MLARDALYLLDGQLNGVREAYRRARVELADHIALQQIEDIEGRHPARPPTLNTAAAKRADAAGRRLTRLTSRSR
jgi:hypothetical protein